MLGAIAARIAPEIEVVTTPQYQPAPDEGLFTGVVFFFLALTLIYVVLRALERRGIISEGPGAKLGRGMGRAMVAFAAFLQPDRPSPDDMPGAIVIVEEEGIGDEPDLDEISHLIEDGSLPDDGLRMSASRDARG